MTSGHTASQWFKGTGAFGTVLTITTQENANKKTFDKRFAIPLDFDFFNYPVYPYSLEK